MKNSVKLLLTVFTLSFLFGNAQEYDDLYFSKKDRKKVKTVNEKKEFSSSTEAVDETNEDLKNQNTSFLGRMYQYDAYPVYDEVNQELIDSYSDKSIADYINPEEEVLVETINPNYSIPEETYQDQNVIINNYYGNSWNRPRRGWGFGSRWNNWGWGSGIYVSYGWGGGFGNPWYDPFWDPFYFNAWNNPWNAGFGFGRGGFYDPFWCPPFYGNGLAWGGRYGGYGYYGRSVAIGNGERGGRRVVRGARSVRGGEVSGSGRSRRLRNTSVASSANESRDFERTQADYLKRSRRTTRVSTTNENATINRSRSSNSSNSRSINLNQNRSQPSYNRGSSNSSRSSSRGSTYRSSSPSRSSGSVRSSGSRSSSRSSSGRSSSSRSSSRSSSSRSRGN